MIDPDLIDCHNEVKEKIDFWHTKMTNQFTRFNNQADMWRLIKPARSGDLSGFANPQLTETTRATEAIATFLYRAMTSAMPNFQFLSNNPMVPQEELWTAEQVVVWQQTALAYRRKLLKACRSLSLFGTVIVEEPWMVNMPYYEGTDFIPRSLLQTAFDPLCFDISLSPWKAVIDYVTDDQLRLLGQKMPDVWDPAAIEEAISSSQDAKNISPEVVARLNNAGYQTYGNGSNYSSKVYELCIYYGPTSKRPGQEVCIGTVNGLKTIKAHESVYKRQPFVVAHLNEFELESYGYGVGRIAESTQPEMNSNRGRMHDTITFSLFNMWLASRMANIKTSQLRVRPWGVVEVDGDPETSLKALRPQLEAVNFGIQMEALMKTEFRSTTGASDNLQAMVTEASATEASIAQTEAVRRLSVIAENVSETLLREHTAKMHENNMTFLDQPFSIAATGRAENIRVYPSDIAVDVEVQTKIVTDKDFRPQRNKDLLNFLQVVTSIRNQNPQMGQVDLKPFVEEFARGVGMNPAKVWQVIPQIPGMADTGPMGGPQIPDVMNRVADTARQAESVRARAGELGQMARQSAQEQLAQAL